MDFDRMDADEHEKLMRGHRPKPPAPEPLAAEPAPEEIPAVIVADEVEPSPE